MNMTFSDREIHQLVRMIYFRSGLRGRYNWSPGYVHLIDSRIPGQPVRLLSLHVHDSGFVRVTFNGPEGGVTQWYEI